MLIGNASPVLKYDGLTATIPVAGEVTVYTRSFPLFLAQFFGIWLRATSTTGTPNIKVELQESWSEPTTEGSAEDSLMIEPDGFDDIFGQVNDENAHIRTIAPVPMCYGRYKITGLTANPADTVVSIKNFLQEGV